MRKPVEKCQTYTRNSSVCMTHSAWLALGRTPCFLAVQPAAPLGLSKHASSWYICTNISLGSIILVIVVNFHQMYTLRLKCLLGSRFICDICLYHFKVTDIFHRQRMEYEERMNEKWMTGVEWMLHCWELTFVSRASSLLPVTVTDYSFYLFYFLF